MSSKQESGATIQNETQALRRGTGAQELQGHTPSAEWLQVHCISMSKETSAEEQTSASAMAALGEPQVHCHKLRAWGAEGPPLY